jgi:hypothetical protein
MRKQDALICLPERLDEHMVLEPDSCINIIRNKQYDLATDGFALWPLQKLTASLPTYDIGMDEQNALTHLFKEQPELLDEHVVLDRESGILFHKNREKNVQARNWHDSYLWPAQELRAALLTYDMGVYEQNALTHLFTEQPELLDEHVVLDKESDIFFIRKGKNAQSRNWQDSSLYPAQKLRAALPTYDNGMYEQNALTYLFKEQPELLDEHVVLDQESDIFFTKQGKNAQSRNWQDSCL